MDCSVSKILAKVAVHISDLTYHSISFARDLQRHQSTVSYLDFMLFLIYTMRWHQGPEQRQNSSFCILLTGLIYNPELLGCFPNLTIMQIECIQRGKSFGGEETKI